MQDLDNHPNPENILSYDLDKTSSGTVNNFTSINSLLRLTGV